MLPINITLSATVWMNLRVTEKKSDFNLRLLRLKSEFFSFFLVTQYRVDSTYKVINCLT